MARPQKEGLDYFSHDTDAVSDEKIEALRALYGNDGYAFYFILLERIYRTSGFEINISDAETIQILSRKVAVTQEVFGQILQTALKWGCFDLEEYEERGVLTSRGIKKRALVVTEKREAMRKKYHIGLREVSASETTQETPPETPQRKGKDSTEKDTKESIPYVEVIDYLNLKAGTAYRPSNKKTRELIHARWSDKFTLENFKTVIDKKCTTWLSDPKMVKYLRPETLFGTKFESYLNEKIITGGQAYGPNRTDGVPQTETKASTRYPVSNFLDDV